jgi:hypothetical protein
VEHDAAVARRRDVVLDGQLKPVIFIGRDQVARVMGIHANEGAILDLPAGADAFALEVVPAGERFTVEEKLPAGFLVLVGELVSGP